MIKTNRRMDFRCDGQTPTCSTCVLYNQKCEYDYSDKRKCVYPYAKIWLQIIGLTPDRQSYKNTAQKLEARVRQLENLLKSHGIDVPPISATHCAPVRNSGSESARATFDEQFNAFERDFDLGNLADEQIRESDRPTKLNKSQSLEEWQSRDTQSNYGNDFRLLNGVGIEALQHNEDVPILNYGDVHLNMFNDSYPCKSVPFIHTEY